MDLSNYYKEYANLADEKILNRVYEKKQELEKIFNQINLKPTDEIVKIAVLGCGDKRLVKYHREIFKDVLKKEVEIITFDISIEHLIGEENVFEHDCTLILPHGPFDIIYAHVLLKFIETEKQWDLISNSYGALKPGGLAIHVLDKEEYSTKELLLSNGQFSVPLDRWKEQLNKMSIEYKEIPVKYGLMLVILKDE